MTDVIAARRGGLIDGQTFRQIDDLYDAAVLTCTTMPASDDAALIAQTKISEFLAHATGVTGHTYGSY